MSALLTDIKNAYFSYNGQGVNLFYGFAAILYFLLRRKRNERNLLIYEIFGIILLATPGIANLVLYVANKGGNDGWLVYGILNISGVAVYAAVTYWETFSGTGKKAAVIVAYLLLVQAGMSFCYTGNHIRLTANTDKVSSEVLEIAESIDSLENPRILAPFEIGSGLRQYDAKYAYIHGDGLTFTQENLSQLQVEAETYECNCIIVNTEYDNTEFFDEIGFDRVCNTEHFVVYLQ